MATVSVGLSTVVFAARLASPKSRILARPSGVIMTFSGLRSRWVTPAVCAASSPSAICAAMSSVLRRGNVAPRRVRPGTSSPDDIEDALVFPDIMHRDDAGMIEGGNRLRFALEALPPGSGPGRLPGGGLLRQLPDRDAYRGAKHFAHPARAQGAEYSYGPSL